MCIRGRAYVCTEYTVAPIHRFDYSSILLACSLTRPLCSNLEAFSLSLSLTRKANVQDCFSSRPPFRFLLACNWKATPFASKLCFFRHRFQLFSIFKRYSPRLPFAFTHVICRCSTLINHSPSSRVFVCAYGHGSRRCFVSTLVTKSDDSFRPVAACNAIFSSLPRGLASGSDAINTLTKYAYHAYAYRLAFHARIINF